MINLAERMQLVLEQAYIDWRAGTDEKDQLPSGRLAAIFKDSGFSAQGVTYKAKGAPSDWCGMSVGAWSYRAGMHPQLRSAFFHTFNVEDHFRYGQPTCRNPRRFMAEVEVDGKWMPTAQWHLAQNAARVWLGEEVIRKGDAARLDIRPGDVVLIDYQGVYDRANDERIDEADHITIASEFNGGVLTVMNGNARGVDPTGRPVTDAVSATRHDLNDPVARKRVYGVGRFSPLDFDLGVTYRSK